MHRLTLAALCALAALFTLAPAAMAAPSDAGITHRNVCGSAPAGYARCHSKLAVGPHGKPVKQQPIEYTAAQLEDAYNLAGPVDNTTVPTGPVIAIVDAFGYANAEADLNTYRAANGMAPCTTANGCFRKLDQNGGSSYPAENLGWAQETALDLDAASAACPSCRILLVQGTTNSFLNLTAAVNTAAAQPGVVAISNSYGGSEFSQETTGVYASAYNHPNVAITVSSGDSGYGVEYPAAANTVVAVGGTSLRTSSTPRGFTETAWSGAGSGCSAYVAKRSWQTDTGCPRRSVADVSAVADPNTGVRVYGPTTSTSTSGWMVVGGTSASAPLVAGVYAAQNDFGGTSYPAQLTYSRASLLNDVTSGSNGRCRTYLCNAGAGYDGPTGLGTPNTSGAF